MQSIRSLFLFKEQRNCWCVSCSVVTYLTITNLFILYTVYICNEVYLNDLLIKFQINRRSTFCFLICSWKLFVKTQSQRPTWPRYRGCGTNTSCPWSTAVCFITNFSSSADSQIKTIWLILILWRCTFHFIDMEKTAERYETILHSSEETIINVSINFLPLALKSARGKR